MICATFLTNKKTNKQMKNLFKGQKPQTKEPVFPQAKPSTYFDYISNMIIQYISTNESEVALVVDMDQIEMPSDEECKSNGGWGSDIEITLKLPNYEVYFSALATYYKSGELIKLSDVDDLYYIDSNGNPFDLRVTPEMEAVLLDFVTRNSDAFKI